MDTQRATGVKEIYLAGGCFWGTEKYLSLIKGVVETEVGYANGPTAEPSYEEVCSGSGHAEAVRVVYQADEVSLNKILELFYEVIDPVSVNRQGFDVGVQYRSGVYYVQEEDRKLILQSLQTLQRRYEKPLAIEAEPLRNFYPAEDYHQNYYALNPSQGYCMGVVSKKVKNFLATYNPDA